MNELEADIYLCLGTFKDIKKLSKDIMDEELDEGTYGKVRGITLTEKRNIICSVLTDNCTKKLYQGVLDHEIVHGVHYILDYIGHSLDYDHGTEILAYYTSYYLLKGREFLQSFKTKKKKKKK